MANTQTLGQQALSRLDPLENIIRADDLVAQEIPEINWIVDGLIPVGLTVFAGSPKAGKSWWALWIALEVASRGVDVLYLALEDTRRRLQDRIRKLWGLKPVPKSLQLICQGEFPRLDKGGLDALQRWIKSGQGQGRLIIVDTLAKIKPTSKGQNTYDEDYQVSNGLKALADNCGVAVLVLHHLRKMVDEDDPFKDISGSTGLTGCADTSLVLKRPRNTNEGWLYVTGRDVEERKLEAQWNRETCIWTFEEIEDKESPLSVINEGKRRVIALLGDRGPLSMRDIHSALGGPEGTMKSRISRMVKDRLLDNEGGIYSMPHHERSKTSSFTETEEPLPPT